MNKVKRVARDTSNSQFFPVTPQTRIFSPVFDVQRPFRAKGLRATPQTRNFSSVFDVQKSISCEKVARGHLKSQFFRSF